MKNPIILILAIIITSYGAAFSQHVFPEKFKGCITDEFALESDSMTVKIEEAELIRVLTGGMDEKYINKIKGTLLLQILVDLQGNSCLLSLENKTNIKTKKLKLKKAIDGNLVWNKPHQKVAAIVAINFEGGRIALKRLGTNYYKGVHELKN